MEGRDTNSVLPPQVSARVSGSEGWQILAPHCPRIKSSLCTKYFAPPLRSYLMAPTLVSWLMASHLCLQHRGVSCSPGPSTNCLQGSCCLTHRQVKLSKPQTDLSSFLPTSQSTPSICPGSLPFHPFTNGTITHAFTLCLSLHLSITFTAIHLSTTSAILLTTPSVHLSSRYLLRANFIISIESTDAGLCSDS